MKALQTRSPIHLYYEYTDLTKVVVSIYLEKDPNNFDTTTTPRYNLQSESINNESIFEISDLLRSANQYEFEKDFYENRDTAIYVLCKADLFDSNDAPIEVRHNFFRIRDGYVERQDQSQILNNILPSDIRNWNDTSATTLITANQNDPFGNNNAYLIGNDNETTLNTNIVTRENHTGSFTFSVFLKKVTNDLYVISINEDFTLKFNFDTEEVLELGSNVIGFDIFKIGDWYKISVALEQIDFFYVAIFSDAQGFNCEVLVFNPTLIKGNHINANATDLVLQDNLKNYSTNNIPLKIILDRKLSTDYEADIIISNLFNNDITRQSVVLPNNFEEIFYFNFDDVETIVELQNIVLYECKYTPVKVTFLNRFGVLQDLVFFKKRVDSSSTDSESYKANVITNGEVYPHLGQRRVYNKQAEASVKLSSGFYPESFNTVFKQLIFSEMVFIDDEPVVISTSTFRQKTQIDDKLINYDIDFDFANDDINSIR